MAEKILFEKNNFILKKYEENQYHVSFSVENSHVNIMKLIKSFDFSFIKLVCQLNNDFIESASFTEIDTHSIHAILIFKHFFKDLGIPQKFMNVIIKKHCETDDCVVFEIITTNNDYEVNTIKAEAMLTQEFIVRCKSSSENVCFESSIILQKSVPIFVENIIGSILFKMFDRTKQFIDNFTPLNK
jgi:hypothetical protein